MSRENGNPIACKMCGHTVQDVVDSRPSGGMIRRRRRCQQCQHRFTTYECVVDERPGEQMVFARAIGLLGKLDTLPPGLRLLIEDLIEQLSKKKDPA